MFEVVKNSELGTIWVPVDYGSTLYVGQLVTKTTSNDYFAAFGAASGASTAVPLGVVVSLDLKEPSFSSTYNANYVAGVSSQADQLARKNLYTGRQGIPPGIGDPMPYVRIKLIGPQTEIKGSLFDSSYGTALTTFNPQAASSTGYTITRSEASASSVAYNSTFYCRAGANKGIQRVPYSVSNSTNVTTNTFAASTPSGVAWPYAIATTDTFVHANVVVGLSKIQLDSLSTFVDAYQTYGSNYYTVIVEEVHLEEAGKEYVILRFK